ncbi:hypothetical protein CSUI_008612 [Cystoisospora suis]|uniref:Transmembrane protein n=1 Tax=Cystoisospora suis TaxID=483139 RepID=A0A2C6KMF3_9APIC|nr:hypothetical protein CSUI_008612 [Cystoisospora suis]
MMLLPLASAAGAFLLWPVATNGVFQNGELATADSESFQKLRAGPSMRSISSAASLVPDSEFAEFAEDPDEMEYEEEDFDNADEQSFVEAAPDTASMNDLRHKVTALASIKTKVQSMRRTYRSSRLGSPNRAKVRAELEKIKGRLPDEKTETEGVIHAMQQVLSGRPGHPETAAAERLMADARKILKEIEGLLATPLA